MTKFSNGFYSRSDSYLKSMSKKDLILYIRIIEKNWQNALITNDIQYHNCKRLLAEERSKAIDEFVERLKDKVKEKVSMQMLIDEDDLLEQEQVNTYIDEIAEQMKAGAEWLR